MTMLMDELVALGIPQEIVDIWKQEESEDLLPVQELAVREGGVLAGQNLLVVAPTSSGKTFIGEMAAVQKALQRVGTVFLVPFKAIAEEKYLDFREKYDAYGIRVVISSGDRRESDDDIRLGTYGIALLTYEKMAGLIVAAPDLLGSCGLVVVDEVQMMMDRQRGPRLELLLTKIRQLRPELQIVALSAVLDELNGFEQWLDCQVVRITERPIELREGIYIPSGEYQYREWNTKREGQEGFPPWPAEDVEAGLDTVVAHLVAGGEQVLVFRNTVDLSRETATRLAQRLAGGQPATATLSRLADLDDTGAKAQLQECLRERVAFHNSELTAEERLIVERGFRDGEVLVVCSTSTLAFGVNLPAKTVVIGDTTEWVGRNEQAPLSVGTYRNMAGRAGRYTFRDEFGRSVLLAETRHDRESYERLYFYGQPEIFTSRLADSPLELQVLDLVTSKLCSREDELVEFLCNTFQGFHSWAGGSRRDELKALVAAAVKRCCDAELLVRSPRERLTASRLGEICISRGFSIGGFITLVDWLSGRGALSVLDALFLATLTDEAMQVRFPLPTAEFRSGMYPQHLQTLLHDETPGEFATRWGLSIREWDTVRRIKMALAGREWVTGRRTREIERQFLVRAGNLRGIGAQLSWVVDVMAAISAEVGAQATIAKELNRLSEQLAYGVPAEGLFLARLDVPGLGRDGIARLLAAGFTTEDLILDAAPGAFQGIVQARVATRLREGIERRVANTLERRKREHIRRIETVQGDGRLARNLYEKEGEDLERILADLLRPPFYSHLCERITKQREGEPDLLLHTENRPLAVQVTAREEGQVKMKKAVEVIGQSARFQPSGYLVVGRPEFHALALQTAREHAAAGTNFKVITITDLCEMYVRFLEGRLDAQRITYILIQEKGVIDYDVINRLSAP